MMNGIMKVVGFVVAMIAAVVLIVDKIQNIVTYSKVMKETKEAWYEYKPFVRKLMRQLDDDMD